MKKTRVLVCAAMIAAGVAATGFYSGDQQLVETTYIIQPGDTLWDIAESYVAKNTGGRRYVLEFKSGIEELNPWLLESRDQLQPGQEIRINYWVKGDSTNE
jgi:nucleoid-associated protein YgaU